MKKNQKKEMHEKTTPELLKAVMEARGEIAKMKQDQVQGKLKNTSMLTVKRKEIAIMQTLFTERKFKNENA